MSDLCSGQRAAVARWGRFREQTAALRDVSDRDLGLRLTAALANRYGLDSPECALLTVAAERLERRAEKRNAD